MVGALSWRHTRNSNFIPPRSRYRSCGKRVTDSLQAVIHLFSRLRSNRQNPCVQYERATRPILNHMAQTLPYDKNSVALSCYKFWLWIFLFYNLFFRNFLSKFISEIFCQNVFAKFFVKIFFAKLFFQNFFNFLIFCHELKRFVGTCRRSCSRRLFNESPVRKCPGVSAV